MTQSSRQVTASPMTRKQGSLKMYFTGPIQNDGSAILRWDQKRGPAVFQPPGINKAGTDLLSHTWTTIRHKDLTSQFGIESGASPWVLDPAQPPSSSRPARDPASRS